MYCLGMCIPTDDLERVKQLINNRSFYMNYGDEQCVGCDASTKGTYRQEPNWHLCNECFKSWLEEKVEENNLTSRRID